MNKWDDELTDYMRASEDKCRTFKMNHIDYSPIVGAWKRRLWLLNRVKRFLEGKVRNPRNLIRDCMKKDVADNSIGDPRQMTMDQVELDIFVCIGQLKALDEKAPQLRREHLKNCLKKARTRQDEERAAIILRILHAEAKRKRMKRIKRTTKPKKGVR